MVDNTTTEQRWTPPMTHNQPASNNTVEADKTPLPAAQPKDHNQTSFKPSKRLTGKQDAFTRELIENPTQPAYKAAQKAGYKGSEATLRAIASENLTKPNIMAVLQRYAVQAENVLLEVMNYSLQLGKTGTAAGAAYASNARQSASDVLDRVHGKATQRTEVTSRSVTLNIDLTGVVNTTDIELPKE